MADPQHPLPPDRTGPGPIEQAEDWLVAECDRVLGCRFRSIESGPGEWSDAYLDRFVQTLPACRVAFLGGNARDNECLDLDSRWAIFVATEWRGQKESERRRGSAGTYRAVSLLAAWLHNCVPGKDVGQVEVKEIVNLRAGQLDRKGVALMAVRLEIPLHFDPEIDCEAFDEFLAAGIDWNIERRDS